MASIPQAPLPQQEIKVAFLGPTGSGKTTLINDMLGLESNAGEPYPGGQPRPGPLGVSAGANSMTSETTVVRGQLIDGTPCTCIDTPGLNDTGNKDSENIVNMVRTLKEQVRVNLLDKKSEEKYKKSEEKYKKSEEKYKKSEEKRRKAKKSARKANIQPAPIHRRSNRR